MSSAGPLTVGGVDGHLVGRHYYNMSTRTVVLVPVPVSSWKNGNRGEGVFMDTVARSWS
jgi:hypothetical protein